MLRDHHFLPKPNRAYQFEQQLALIAHNSLTEASMIIATLSQLQTLFQSLHSPNVVPRSEKLAMTIEFDKIKQNRELTNRNLNFPNFSSSYIQCWW